MMSIRAFLDQARILIRPSYLRTRLFRRHRALSFVFLMAACLAVLHGAMTPARAQASCGPESETVLREQVLGGRDIAQAQRYLSCFPYGDGAPSVRRHERELRFETECRTALGTDDPTAVRSFILKSPDNPCAREALDHLKRLEALPTYKSYANSIFTGTQLARGRVADLRACAKSCGSRGEACAGYSFETGNAACTLWSAITGRLPRGQTESGALADVLLATAPDTRPAPPPVATAPTPDYDSLFEIGRGLDIPGGDIQMLPGIDFEACLMNCANLRACVGLTYSTEDSVCFIKNQILQTIRNPSAISAAKRNPAASAPPPAVASSGLETILQNVDLANDTDRAADYRRLGQGNINLCRQACERDQGCRAYTYNIGRKMCILKRSFQSRREFSGAFSGIKN
jgi:hypothetical protein